MDFVKKHYEKILLSVVLVGLAVAAAWLPIKVSSVKESLQAATTGYGRINPKPLPALDLSTNQAALARVKKPRPVGLAKPGHNVFNPIQWKKKADGTPIPFADIGLQALSITNIVPLRLRIEYQGTKEASGNQVYLFQVTREASTNVLHHRPVQRQAAPGSKNEIFVLKDVKGPKESPSELMLELVEYKTTVTVSKEAPCEYVAGYAADLRYETDNRVLPRQRVGQKLTLSGNNYNIVAIGPSDVTLEDSQTKKRTTLRWSGAM